MVSKSLQQRATTLQKRMGPIQLLGAQHISCHMVNLPKAPARQHAAMLRFAIEEHIAAPLDSVAIAIAPQSQKQKSQFLVFVTDRARLTGMQGPALPEFLMIPPPKTDHTWHVWCDKDHVVVRKFDGAGFACTRMSLPLFWAKAGCPQLHSFADPLPDTMGAYHSHKSLPPPDRKDLGVRFAAEGQQDGPNVAHLMLRLLRIGSLAAVVALGLIGLDNWALKQKLNQERQNAQAAIAPHLPGVIVSSDVTPLLNRLMPQSTPAETGAFLPLLADVSAVFLTLAGDGAAAPQIRRLAWGAAENQLIILLEAQDLATLQRAQQRLEDRGFQITTGAANAQDGGAEVEMRIQANTGGGT